MAIEGINGSTLSQIATSQTAATTSKPEVATSTQEKTKTVATPAYTVELTGPALAKSMKLAGQNPAQIALKMGVDIKTIDNYLNIKVATKTPTPVVSAPAPTQTTETKPATPDAPVNTAEEAKEPAAEKATETAQGKN